MNKRDKKKFEKMLIEERDRLNGTIRKIEESTREDSGRDHYGDIASYAETGSDNFELETALNIASGESNWLKDINEALQRLDNDSYGICEECQEEIPKKRLEAFPSARHCIKCQEEFERENSIY